MRATISAADRKPFVPEGMASSSTPGQAMGSPFASRAFSSAVVKSPLAAANTACTRSKSATAASGDRSSPSPSLKPRVTNDAALASAASTVAARSASRSAPVMFPSRAFSSTIWSPSESNFSFTNEPAASRDAANNARYASAASRAAVVSSPVLSPDAPDAPFRMSAILRPSNPASSAAAKSRSTSAEDMPSSVARSRRSNSVPSVPSSSSDELTVTFVAPKRARNASARSSLARSSAASLNAARIASAASPPTGNEVAAEASVVAGAGAAAVSTGFCAASRRARTSPMIWPNRVVAGSRLRSALVNAALATRLCAAPASPATTARRRFRSNAFARKPRGVGSSSSTAASSTGAGAGAGVSVGVEPIAVTGVSTGAGAGSGVASSVSASPVRQPPHRSLRCAALRRALSRPEASGFRVGRCSRASAKTPSNRPSCPFARNARARSFASFVTSFVAFVSFEASSFSRSNDASVDGETLGSDAPASAPATRKAATQSAAATRKARMEGRNGGEGVRVCNAVVRFEVCATVKTFPSKTPPRKPKRR